MDRDDSIRALTRGLAVLEAMNQSRVTSIATLHTLTGLPKPSLVRLMRSLAESGYVVRVSHREGYALTDAVLRLASGVRHRDVVVDVARPLMEAFTRRHKWQVSLATSETDSMLIRFSTRHISPFSREQNFLNRRVHMIQSAVGRAHFAYCSDDERSFILNFLRGAKDSIVQRWSDDDLTALVDRVRSNGYATTERPGSDSTRSFAVPVMELGAEDSPLGSIAFFYYSSAMTRPQATRRYLPALRQLAEDIASGLAQARDDAERAHAIPLR